MVFFGQPRDPTHNAQNLKQRPPGKFAVLARLSRAPERSVRWYVSTGAQRKRSQNPKSPGVVEARDGADGSTTIDRWQLGNAGAFGDQRRAGEYRAKRVQPRQLGQAERRFVPVHHAARDHAQDAPRVETDSRAARVPRANRRL